jgi:hypothetical protein
MTTRFLVYDAGHSDLASTSLMSHGHLFQQRELSGLHKTATFNTIKVIPASQSAGIELHQVLPGGLSPVDKHGDLPSNRVIDF